MSPLSMAFRYWVNGLPIPATVAKALQARGYDPQALEAVHRAQRAE